MKHGSLFSGIGGFDLAAEWMGWENVFHCEWNEFGQKILNYYWPKAISYGDITKTDFTIHRGRIDILTGGFPCQPYSVAGKRKGKEDDRHLWPEMLRAIREIAPTYVVGENVGGIVNWNGGLVFEEVQSDMEAQGYEVIPVILPACAIDAEHRRDRTWFVSRIVPNPGGNGFDRDKKPKERRDSFRCGIPQHELDTLSCVWSSTNPNGGRLSIQGRPERQINPEKKKNWKKHRVINDGGWPHEPPICTGNDGLSERLDGITFLDWSRESIKAGGNAIVPQVVYEIFKAIDAYDKITKT